jgi:hypothetical protein
MRRTRENCLKFDSRNVIAQTWTRVSMGVSIRDVTGALAMPPSSVQKSGAPLLRRGPKLIEADRPTRFMRIEEEFFELQHELIAVRHVAPSLGQLKMPRLNRLIDFLSRNLFGLRRPRDS